jgi:L-iditol 2-dehydrogenase
VSALPGTGRAAVHVASNEPLEIREFPLTEPGPGELLVEIDAATVCGTDVHNWQGAAGGRLRPPVVPGHEGVGRIVSFGDGERVDSRGAALAAGDRIVWGHAACGSCYGCTILRDETLCERRVIGMLRSAEEPPFLHGTFADYAYVHPRAGRIRVPDSVDSEKASAASCALRSVMAAFERLGPLDSRHTVVVQGTGPLGLFAVAVAATHSPSTLIAIGAPHNRVECALALGADHAIDIEAHPDPAERVDMVRKLTSGRGADVVFEFTGSSPAMGEGVLLAARKARYVMAGAVNTKPAPVSVETIISKNLTIVGSLGATIGAYASALEFIERFDDALVWDGLLGPGRYGLREATTALERTAALAETKAVIRPSLDR